MQKILLTLALVTSGIAFSQSPQGINYQATIRNSTGALMINQSTTVKFTVHQGEATGTAVYQEQHTTTTDNVGAFKLIFGQGTPLTGMFNQINWSLGNFHLEIEVNTGQGFISLGTTQLLSVPYALYAERSGSFFAVNIQQMNSNLWTDENSDGQIDEGEISMVRYLDINTDIAPGDDENFIDEGYVVGLTQDVNLTNNVHIYSYDEYNDDTGPGFFSERNGMLLNTTYYIKGFAKRSDNTYVFGKAKTVTTTP